MIINETTALAEVKDAADGFGGECTNKTLADCERREWLAGEACGFGAEVQPRARIVVTRLVEARP